MTIKDELPDGLLQSEEVISASNRLTSFPTELLLPKGPTQQEAFLQKYPSFDGRGIVIGVLDTGVDPALPGLQVTTTGERKIIDVVDCSGAGDVDTSTVKTAENGVVIGLTGRKLQIPAEWENPSNKYHLGIKSIYELYSSSLLKTIKEETNKNVWDPIHQMTMSDVQRAMKKHEEAVGGYSEKIIEKYEREDLASQIDYLKSADSFFDKGPIADCLVWHDGKQWKACVDTSFRGRLKLCTPMGSFKETGEFNYLTERDQATYSFRINSNGNSLEIVVTNGAHGSHVANIAAANFPEDPKLNGLAPGAKIVSFCIGDNRMDSLETGTGLTRAFNMCADYGVNVLNMSFGEGTHIPNQGRIIEELQYLVEKHNVICCISVGNSGPALSTAGAPGGTTSLVLGIGACLFPSMVDPLYGCLSTVEGNLYPWSSRGPSADASVAVSLCAPGAAMTGVPKSCRRSAQMMNGTSMSSPNAAGSIACVLSGLKANNRSWTYYQVRMALENSALQMDEIDKFSQGNGIVQIENAYDYLMKHDEFLPSKLVDLKIDVHSKRGIYLREFAETQKKTEYLADITPVFATFSDPVQSIEFTKNVLLKCNAPWVRVPETFMLVACGRNFRIEVDPTQLPPGSVNYTEVCAIDPLCPELGPLFRVPITVIIPEVPLDDGIIEFGFDSHPGEIVRRFVHIPKEANVMEVEIINLSKVPQDQYTLHAVYLDHLRSSRNSELHKTLTALTEWKNFLRVTPGRTAELCVARTWSRNGDPSKILMKVKFHGIQRDALTMYHGEQLGKATITAASFRNVDILPTIALNFLFNTVQQSSPFKIEPLGPQDVFQSGFQIHRLLLTYKYTVTKASGFYFVLGGLTRYLYESPVDCVRCQVFTSNKEYVGASGVYPERNPVHLEAGEYIIQVQVRHHDLQVLENLRDIPLQVVIKLPQSIKLDLFRTIKQAVTETKETMKKTILGHGKQFSFFYRSLAPEKFKGLPVRAGSTFSGNLKVLTEPNGRAVDETSFTYVVPEFSEKSSAGLSEVVMKEKPEKKTLKQQMDERLRDIQIVWLANLTDEKEADLLYNELVAKYPTHLPLLLSKLDQIYKKNVHNDSDMALLNQICEQIMDICKPTEVLQFFGCCKEGVEDQVNIKKDMEKRKEAIIGCLLVKAHVLANNHLRISTLNIPPSFREANIMELASAFPPVIQNENQAAEAKFLKNDKVETVSSLDEITDETPKKEEKPNSVSDDNTASDPSKKEDKTEGVRVTREMVDSAYFELLKWTGSEDNKVLFLSAKQAIAHEHFGRALKFLQKASDAAKSKGTQTCKIDTAVSEICDNLGWVHISNLMKNKALHKKAVAFRPFQCIQ